MKICYLADSLVPSRTANSIHVMQMCQAYAVLGHQVTLVLPDRREGTEAKVGNVYAFYGVHQAFTIRKIPIPRRRSSTLYFGVLLPFAALLSRPAIIHTRSLGSAWGATNLFRKSTIFEIHQSPYRNYRQHAFFEHVIYSRYLRALVTITHALANHVRRMLSKDMLLIVAPDGVDTMSLKQPLSQADARAKLGLSNETRQIAVYTGSLYHGRGIELIIYLAQILSDHLFLVVGGRDSDLDSYRWQASGCSNLVFTGFVPPSEVKAYHVSADVLLMPHGNIVEGIGGTDIADFTSPIKMFEYMAAAKPIVASTLPVLQEVLQNENNALLVPHSEPSLWVRALLRLSGDKQLALRLGQKAYSDVKNFTWEERARRILRVIEKE